MLNISQLLELSLSINVFSFISNRSVFESFLYSLIEVTIKKRVVRKHSLVKVKSDLRSI